MQSTKKAIYLIWLLMALTFIIMIVVPSKVKADDSIQKFDNIELLENTATHYIDDTSLVKIPFRLLDSDGKRISSGDSFYFYSTDDAYVEMKNTISNIQANMEVVAASGSKISTAYIAENDNSYYPLYDYMVCISPSVIDSDGINLRVRFVDKPGKYALLTITVPEPTIKLSSSKINLLHGNYTPLTATVTGLKDTSSVMWTMREGDDSSTPSKIETYAQSSKAHTFKETSSTGATHNVVCVDGTNGDSTAIAYITYSSGGSQVYKSASCYFNSTGSLTLSCDDTVSLGNYITCTISQSGFNINASNQPTWESSDDTVAYVSPFSSTTYNKVYIMARGVGTTTISVSLNGFTASCQVTVPAPSVKYSSNNITINANSTKTISVTLVSAGEDAVVEWGEIPDSSVASTYLASAATWTGGDISNYADGSQSGSILNLSPSASNQCKVTISPLDYGTTYLAAFVRDPDYLNSAGEVVTTVKTFRITVSPPTLSIKDSCSLNYGSTTKITASVSKALSDYEVVWKISMIGSNSSSKKNIKIIDNESTDSRKCTIKSIVSKACGKYCYLTAYLYAKDGSTVVAKDTTVVTVKAANIYFSDDSKSIVKGKTSNISVSTKNSDKDVTVTWKSSKKSVATIKKSSSNEKSAKITAKKAGTTKITAKLPNGKTAKLTLKVTKS